MMENLKNFVARLIISFWAVVLSTLVGIAIVRLIIQLISDGWFGLIFVGAFVVMFLVTSVTTWAFIRVFGWGNTTKYRYGIDPDSGVK